MLDGPSLRTPRWSPDGLLVAYLRDAPASPYCYDLWVADRLGARPPRRLLAASDASGNSSPEQQARKERQRSFGTGVGDFAWSACGRYIVAVVGNALTRIEVGSGTCSALGPDDVSDVQPAPAGGRVGYVRDGALWVCDLVGGNAERVSPLAEGAVRYGVAEFVAQEEFARDTGYWWRPDGGAIVYARVDETAVTPARRIEIGVDGPTIVEQRFPRAGTANALVTLAIQPLGGGAGIEIDLGDDPDYYLLRVDWSCAGDKLYVQRQARDQRRVDLLVVDPATGRSHTLLVEKATPWVNPNLEFRALADGGFLLLSERSGYCQLYRYGPDGALCRQVTDGPLPLGARDRELGLAGIDEASGLAYVMSGVDDALERQLYAVSYDGCSDMMRITTEPGWWDISMAPDGGAFVGTFSSPSQPPCVSIRSVDGTRLAWLEQNALNDNHPYAPYASDLPQPEFGRLRALDGQRMDYVLLRPAQFDPQHRYPAILQVYGGPGRQHVKKAWRSVEERAFLDAGYVLFQLDNRGAAGRGIAFEAPIAGVLGTPELADQRCGLDYLKSLPFVDPQRIGAMGWSYGGYMTLRLMTEPGSGICAGIAGGSVATWDDYDTHYTEHYLGRPQAAPEAYRAASILPRLDKLEGRLMLVHGLADDNVLIDHLLAIVGTLQRLGTTFDLTLYPDQRHAIVGAAAQRHRLISYREFFDRELGHGHG